MTGAPSGVFAPAGLFALALLTACAAGDAAQSAAGYDLEHLALGTSTAGILVRDVDGDGRAEVLAPGGDRLAVIGSAEGAGLRVRQRLDAGEGAAHVAAGDIDGDGRLDLVVANHDTDHVTVLRGGPAGFAPAMTVTVDVSPHPHAVALADVDADGRPELLIDDRDAAAIRVVRPDSRGGFQPAGRIDVGGGPYRGMAVADVDGDGDLDVVTPNPSDIAIRLGDGAGGFEPGPTLTPRGFRPFTVAVGDFDGDAVPDIAAGSGEGPGGAAIWLGDGRGGFEPAPGSPFEIGDGPTASAVADVDGDGIDDLLLTSWTADEVAIIHGGRSGHRVVRIPVPGSPWGIDAGDLDADGDVDIGVGQGSGDGVVVLWRQ